MTQSRIQDIAESLPVVPTLRLSCPICGSPTEAIGTRHGGYVGRDFELRRCPDCRFGFVADPLEDHAGVYDERYYAGEGPDPLVDYSVELEQPERTVRAYEWQGIERVVADLLGRDRPIRWLDYGCGNGGLVRHLRGAGHDAQGFDEGAIVHAAAERGIPIVSRSELPRLAGTFDIVTAIEVLEHTLDPLAELRTIRPLLRPGGLLFLTTGNAAPFADRLTRWSYVTPEIHVSFFEPATLERALRLSGFVPEQRDLGPGFDLILKFKVLKNLRIRRRSRLLDLIPARLLARPGDRYARLSAHPIGWVQEDPSAGEGSTLSRP